MKKIFLFLCLLFALPSWGVAAYVGSSTLTSAGSAGTTCATTSYSTGANALLFVNANSNNTGAAATATIATTTGSTTAWTEITGSPRTITPSGQNLTHHVWVA